MKPFGFVWIVLLTLQNFAFAQSFRGIDRSPADIAYFPDNFAHDRKGGEKAIIKIIYNRPQKKGRKIFGELVPYGEVWRTGANEATEVKLYQDVNFGGKMLKAGTYSLFTIPTEDNWTIIFSKDLDCWGSYNYNPDNDALRVVAPARQTDKTIEAFSIKMIQESNFLGKLLIAWDTTIVELSIGW